MSCITVYNKLQELAQYHSDSWADGAIITIGRDERTNFPLPNITSLSGHHLSIRKLAGDFYIRDEQSSNGTTADGQAMTHALRMHAQVVYQAGPITIYLEDAPLSQPNPEENADSVFPEPYGFAALEQDADPIAAESYYEEPAPAVEAVAEAYAEPAPVVEEVVFDLEQMAALKQGHYQEEQPAPQEYIPIEPEPVYQPVAEPVYEPVDEAVYEPVPDNDIPAEGIVETPATIEKPISVPKKKISYKNGVARPFLPIAGIPKTGIPKDFTLEVKTPSGEPYIVEGENLKLLVRTSKKCKLILICQEEDGTKTMLYPNKYQTSMDIPANKWVTIPEEGAYDYELSIEGVGSIDTIQVIARESTTRSFNRVEKPKTREELKALEGKKEEKPRTKWSHALLELEVISADASA